MGSSSETICQVGRRDEKQLWLAQIALLEREGELSHCEK